MGHPQEESAEDPSALEEQQALLEDCLDLVWSIYDSAHGKGMSQPVVILLDCEDQIGGEIARSWLGNRVDEAIEDRRSETTAEEESEGMTTVYAQAFPWNKCNEQIPEVFPYLGPVFDVPYPDDGFLAISVTCGGASALTVPFDARESLS